MKKLIKAFKLIPLLVIALFVTGCASPDTAIGARTRVEVNKDIKNESVQFKYAFQRQMTYGQRKLFLERLKDVNAEDTSLSDLTREVGSNALLVGASGGFSSGIGDVAMLGFGLYDSYKNSRPLSDDFSAIYFDRKWLGSDFNDADHLLTLAINRTVDALIISANEFGYDVNCFKQCGSSYGMYKLVKQKDSTLKPIYDPKVIVVAFQFTKPIANLDTDKLIFPNSVPFYSPIWHISFFQEEDVLHLSTTKQDLDINNEIAEWIPLKTWGKLGVELPITRSIMLGMSRQIPNWVFNDTTSVYRFSMFNGKNYEIKNRTDYTEMFGYETYEAKD